MARRRIPIGHHGSISVHKRGVNFVARCRFRDDDGVLREVAASGKTKDEARHILQADINLRKASPRTSAASIWPDTPVCTLIDKWLEHSRSRNLSVSTLRIYEASARLYLRPYMNGWRVRDATAGRVNDLLHRHMERGLDTKALRKHLHQIFALAVLEGALQSNPVAAVPRSRRSKPPTVRINSADQVAKIAALIKAWETAPRPGPAPNDDLFMLLMLLVATGARPGELLALRWSDLHLDAERPYLCIEGTIKQEKGKGIYRQAVPKSVSSIRKVEVPPGVVGLLVERRLAQGRNPLGAVFPSRAGTWQAPTNMRRRWVLAVAGTTYGGVTFRTFRKSVASLLAETYGLTVAKEQLGHASETTTRSFYADQFRDAPRVAEAIESLLGDVLDAPE